MDEKIAGIKVEWPQEPHIVLPTYLNEGACRVKEFNFTILFITVLNREINKYFVAIEIFNKYAVHTLIPSTHYRDKM